MFCTQKTCQPQPPQGLAAHPCLCAGMVALAVIGAAGIAVAVKKKGKKLVGALAQGAQCCMDGAQSVCREVMQKAEQKMGGGQNGDSCCHSNGNSDQSNGESQSSGDSSDSDSQSDS